MPTYSDQFVDPDSFDPADWQEIMGSMNPVSDQFSADNGTARLQGQVPWEDSYALLLKCIGYHYVDESKRLRRVIPIKHPYYDWMYCTGVSDFRGKAPDFVEGIKETYEAPGALPSLAKYKKVMATLEFQTPPAGVQFKEDTEVAATGEYDRYVSVDIKPKYEILSVDAGQIVFANGPAAILNQPVGSFTFIPETKANVVVTWYRVPRSYIFDEFNPSKILACMGKVNSAEIWGFGAGTLLFLGDGLEFSYKPAPLRIGGESAGLCYVDVKLPFLWFNPTNAIAAPDAGNDVRGHNLKPAPYGSTEVGKYYPIRFNRTGSTEVFTSADFTTMFTHWAS